MGSEVELGLAWGLVSELEWEPALELEWEPVSELALGQESELALELGWARGWGCRGSPGDVLT